MAVEAIVEKILRSDDGRGVELEKYKGDVSSLSFFASTFNGSAASLDSGSGKTSFLHRWVCRKEQFDKFAVGRAAQAQLQQIAKQSVNSNKWQMT